MACDLENVREPLRSIAKRIIAESGGRIGCSSGYRSTAHQQKLWEKALAKYGDPEIADNWVARPGHSHHEKGMAVDFSGDMELLAQLGPKYGLYQPMANENWHWELGEGQEFAGETPLNQEFDLGGQQNPQDVLANRLTTIMRLMGGADPAMGMAESSLSQYQQLFPDDMEAGMVQSVPTTVQAGSGSAAEYQKYAAKKAAEKYGWGPEEMQALIELWNRESNWNPDADNPTSSAAGIAQKMTSIHGAIEPTAFGQIDWGLNYIAQRYGSPSRALSFHDRNNYY